MGNLLNMGKRPNITNRPSTANGLGNIKGQCRGDGPFSIREISVLSLAARFAWRASFFAWLGVSVIAFAVMSDARIVMAQSSVGNVIEVSGEGEVRVLPDQIFLTGELDGNGELAEAKKMIDGYKSDIDKVMANEAFAAVKLVYKERSVGIGSDASRMEAQMMMNGEIVNNTSSESSVRLTQTFELSLDQLSEENFDANIETMKQLASSLQDVQIRMGTTVGNSYTALMQSQGGQDQYIRVRLSDRKRGWTMASTAAFVEAKEKATLLAEIAGGQLGPALSISTVLQTDSSNSDLLPIMQMYGMAAGFNAGSNEQVDLNKIPVKVKMVVKFSFVTQ